MQVFQPGPLLRPFVQSYTVIESRDALVNRVLPDTRLVMAFRFKGAVDMITPDNSFALGTSVMSGLRKSSRFIRYAPDTGNILVIFREGAAPAFFKEPLHELYNQNIALSELAGFKTVAAIEDQLSTAASHLERVAILEHFLLQHMIRAGRDERVIQAIQTIRQSRGALRMQELSKSLFISQDALEKGFRRTVGVSPKQFSSIIRMQGVVNTNAGQHSLTDMAYTAGYYDQVHFIKDFRNYTGQTPTDFYKSPLFW